MKNISIKMKNASMKIICIIAMLLILGSSVPISGLKADAYGYSASNTSYSTVRSVTSQKVTVKSAYSSGTNAVKISWNKVKGASGYRIYKYDFTAKKWKGIKNTKSTSYKDTSLKSGTIYKYCVKAYSKKNGKTYWSKRSSTKTVSTRPSSVSGIFVNGHYSAYDDIKVNSTAVIEWGKVSCDGYVLMKADQNGNYTKVKTLKGKTNTSVTIKDLKHGKSYSYGIKPYKSDKNGKNNYGKISTVSFTTDETDWVDELNSVDRAYYNFMANNFSDNDWEIIKNDMADYAINTFQGKSGWVKFYCDGKYFYPNSYEEKYIEIPINIIIMDEPKGGYEPGTSWDNDSIESYEDVEIFKSWVYAKIEGTVSVQAELGNFTKISPDDTCGDAPLGFEWMMWAGAPVINVLYG